MYSCLILWIENSKLTIYKILVILYQDNEEVKDTHAIFLIEKIHNKFLHSPFSSHDVK